MNKLRQIWLMAALLAMPLAAGAQRGNSFRSIEGALNEVIRIINQYIIPLIIGAAVILFLVGVLKYVRSQGDEKNRAEARNMMIWGIVAIFVMTSVWGLVNVLGDTLNLDQGVPDLPDIPGPEDQYNN